MRLSVQGGKNFFRVYFFIIQYSHSAISFFSIYKEHMLFNSCNIRGESQFIPDYVNKNLTVNPLTHGIGQNCLSKV